MSVWFYPCKYRETKRKTPDILFYQFPSTYIQGLSLYQNILNGWVGCPENLNPSVSCPSSMLGPQTHTQLAQTFMWVQCSYQSSSFCISQNLIVKVRLFFLTLARIQHLTTKSSDYLITVSNSIWCFFDVWQFVSVYSYTYSKGSLYSFKLLTLEHVYYLQT